MNSLERPCISTESTSCAWALSEKIGKWRWAETEWVKTWEQYRDKEGDGVWDHSCCIFSSQFWRSVAKWVLESKWKVPGGNEREQRIRSGNTIKNCPVHTPLCQELIMDRTTWWCSTFIFFEREVCPRQLSSEMEVLLTIHLHQHYLWS